MYRPNAERVSLRTYSPTRVDAQYRKSIDSNYVDQEGRTSLHLAVLQHGDDEEAVKHVIRAGVNINASDKHGCRCVHYAAEKGLTRYTVPHMLAYGCGDTRSCR